MKAHHHLLKTVLFDAATVSVHDGEQWNIVKSTNGREILDAIESVEECTLRIKVPGIPGALTVYIVDTYYDDTVVDYTDHDYLNNWHKKYTARLDNNMPPC